MISTDFEKMSKILTQWCNQLYETNPKINCRGDRAELRRSKSILDVIMTPSYQQLCTQIEAQMKNKLLSDYDKERLAFIVGLLAHVREHERGGLAKSMAKGKPTPCVSALRFRRLLQHEQDDRFYAAMIRIIRMLKYKVKVDDLIKSMYYWNESTKKQWAYAYFS